ncbi:MAG: ribbon-helix-helix protein, CopG family [Sphingobium sp.]|nr:MAG: ribbon-helix-helix protein, CopG family [Sphingobium sp.]
MEDLQPAIAWRNALCLIQSEAGGDARRSLRQDRWMEEQIAITLPTELLDRVDHMARRTGRSRADIITSALHRGLRDDERA